MGNFALLPQLPQMYEDCKKHEHPDMNAWEFITDHLVNIDGVFDNHEDGDEQKPHSPQQSEKFFQQTNFCIPIETLYTQAVYAIQLFWQPLTENYKGNYNTRVFKPPTV
ncbi:MAG: hypothetical protein ACN6I4_01425 [bacterium]